jgi:hypothetical protein
MTRAAEVNLPVHEVYAMADTAKQAKTEAAVAVEVEPKTGVAASPIPDPFDLKTLVLNPSYLESAKVKRVRPVVTGKPNGQEFIRVHPSPDYRAAFGMIDMKEDREDYLVVPELVPQLPGECVIKIIYTTISRSGIIRLWPVRIAGPDEKDMLWWRSAHDAANKATTHWVRVKANMMLGANEYFIAESEIPEPNWADVAPFQVLLADAYRTRIVRDLEHPVLKKLRGLA